MALQAVRRLLDSSMHSSLLLAAPTDPCRLSAQLAEQLNCRQVALSDDGSSTVSECVSMMRVALFNRSILRSDELPRRSEVPSSIATEGQGRRRVPLIVPNLMDAISLHRGIVAKELAKMHAQTDKTLTVYVLDISLPLVRKTIRKRDVLKPLGPLIAFKLNEVGVLEEMEAGELAAEVSFVEEPPQSAPPSWSSYECASSSSISDHYTFYENLSHISSPYSPSSVCAAPCGSCPWLYTIESFLVASIIDKTTFFSSTSSTKDTNNDIVDAIHAAAVKVFPHALDQVRKTSQVLTRCGMHVNLQKELAQAAHDRRVSVDSLLLAPLGSDQSTAKLKPCFWTPLSLRPEKAKNRLK